MLPNFLIIGAQKCGTTWLASMLRQHPEVYMPEVELHFFDKSFNYSKGVGWYERYFTDGENKRAVGEKTPDYFWANGQGGGGHLPEVHRNIYATLPEAKLIVALRNPVERAISAAKHIIRSGRVSPLHRMDELLVGEKTDLLTGFGVFEMGRFYTLLTAYLELFRREQILVIFFEEDIVQEPLEGLKKVCAFLDIDGSWPFLDLKQRVNRFSSSKLHLMAQYYFPILSAPARVLGRFLPEADYRPSLSVVQHLYDLYEEENQKLFALLQREPPVSWLEP